MRFDQRDLAAIDKALAIIGTRRAAEISRLGLNDMAFDVLRQNKVLMSGVFDNPTRFTLNAFFVRKATTQSLSATVERKTVQSGRHYLETQQDGGARKMAGFERLLSRRVAYSGIIQSVLPTKRLRKNRYGNIASGRLQQILSGVRAQGERHQNTTAASAKRNKGKRAEYFVPNDGSALSPGVYQRKGKKISKVLAFSAVVPSYSARFPMEAHAATVAAAGAADAFSRAFSKTMRRR